MGANLLALYFVGQVVLRCRDVMKMCFTNVLVEECSFRWCIGSCFKSSSKLEKDNFTMAKF